MAGTGFHNHYDDPDEFWDEEPLEIRPRTTTPPEPAHRPIVPELADVPPVNRAPSPSASRSSILSMRLDSGFLPIQVNVPQH